jgi:uncharacterized short protein YbdD (DUF466 family)
MEFTLVGIRIHVKNDQEEQDWYIDNLIKWLEYRKYTIIKYTIGAHINTSNEHIHIHLYVSGKKLSNPIATMKRDYETGKITTEYKNVEQTKKYKTVTGDMYKGKINMSIQMKTIKETDENDIERYLQYPLKEGLVLRTNLPPDEAKQLQMNAKAEYAAAKQKQLEREKKEKKGMSDWEEFVNHLDQYQPETIRKAYRIAIEYYRAKYDKPPTGKVIADNTERYCIKRNILTTEQLVERYLSFY